MCLIESRLLLVSSLIKPSSLSSFVYVPPSWPGLTVLSEDVWPQDSAPHLLAPPAGAAGGSLLSLRLQAGRSAKLF